MRPLLSEPQARWPRRVPKLPNAKGGRVYACYDRTYVVTSGGAAYGWGDNYGGVVGPQPNTTTKWSGARWWEPTEEPPEPPYVAEPTELRKSIGGGAPVAQVACGYVHTILVLKGGEVHAWNLGGVDSVLFSEHRAGESHYALGGGIRSNSGLPAEALPGGVVPGPSATTGATLGEGIPEVGLDYVKHWMVLILGATIISELLDGQGLTWDVGTSSMQYRLN